MSEQRAVGPCRFPRCSRGDAGNPQLITTGTFCEPCQRRYRRVLDWVVLDYSMLKRDMPLPARLPDDGNAPAGRSKTFGHPAEWASVTAAQIADSLNWAEDHLRDVQHHEPPPHPGVAEGRRVAHAYRYLTAQFGALCTYEAAPDTAAELSDLHHHVRRVLGYTRYVQHLPTPCPWCDVAALVRDVGNVECRECGRVIDEKHYGWLAGWAVDRLIEEYEARTETQILA